MKEITAMISMISLFLVLIWGRGNVRNQAYTEVSVTSAKTKVQVSTESETTAPVKLESIDDHSANTERQIQITNKNGKIIVFMINDSTAANDLYNQLPLSTHIENYADNEKIFYPLEKLDTNDTSMAYGTIGSLTYYEPWGDVAIFYNNFDENINLYALGEAISGVEYIADITGEVLIEAVEDSSPTAKPKKFENITEPTYTQFSNLSEMPHTEEINSHSQASVLETKVEAPLEENVEMKMNVQVGSSTFTATLEDNSTVDSFTEMMKTTPVVIQMSDYSGFEKVGFLGTNLPANNSQTTTQAGDIVLYNGSQIVIFYGSNSWNYTRLGKIDNLDGWTEALGNGDVTVTFSMN